MYSMQQRQCSRSYEKCTLHNAHTYIAMRHAFSVVLHFRFSFGKIPTNAERKCVSLFLNVCWYVCVHTVCRVFKHISTCCNLSSSSPIFANVHSGYRKQNVTHFHLFHSPVKLKQEERRQPNLQLWNIIIIFKVVCMCIRVYAIWDICVCMFVAVDIDDE